MQVTAFALISIMHAKQCFAIFVKLFYAGKDLVKLWLGSDFGIRFVAPTEQQPEG